MHENLDQVLICVHPTIFHSMLVPHITQIHSIMFHGQVLRLTWDLSKGTWNMEESIFPG